MTFAASLVHVKTDFVEMPWLELTVGQAVRLWGLGADDCRYVIDALVDDGFLRWTPARTIVRNSRGRRSSSGRQPSRAAVPRITSHEQHAGAR